MKMVWFVAKNKIEYKELFEQLNQQGFTIKYYPAVSEALKNLVHEMPQAIFFDADQSEISCIEFCWMIKHASEYRKIKFFIISGNSHESVEVAAFESGADEFILKPIRINALLKRIIIRLKNFVDSSVISCTINGNSALQIDKDSFSVYLNKIPVILSKKEFELLYLIASQPGKVFTRNEICMKVWQRPIVENDRTIDVHILRLRKKLGEEIIYTHKGIGYRLSQ